MLVRFLMKLGIMQPYFFPYIGYWQLINAVDKYVVYDDVTYIKGGWISRNNILLNNSKHMLTLPLVSPSSFKKINEIDITKEIKMKEKVIKTIKTAYLKAPYYKDIIPFIERLFDSNTNIATLNYNAILEINNYLEITTEVLLSSAIEKDNSLKGQDKVLHINKVLGADIYINAIGGKKLYSKDKFEEKNIKLFFLQTGDIKYKQYNDEFISNLSIIDVLMFNDKKKIQDFLNNYTLI